MLVFLTGFMASGKSTVGRRLAASLGVEFVDLDAEIEDGAGMSVAEIFRCEGESAFRARETAVLAAASQLGSAVVATGGGVVLAEENRAFLARGTTVWLNPSLDILKARLAASNQRDRPLAAADLESLWRRRLPLYKLADFEVPVAQGETVDETARRVQTLLEERRCAT